MASAFRRHRAVAVLLLTATSSGCLSESLIKQPELTVIPGAPAGWSGTVGTPGIGTTVSDRKSGAQSAYLSNAFQLNIGSYTIVQSIRADTYRGQRLRLSAWVKPRNVGSVRTSGLFMRIDGPGITLGFDDMARRTVFGYGDWRQVAVVLDVPANAIGISFGAQFAATNTLLVDDMRLEVVGTDVASTNTLSGPVPSALDSSGTVALYERRANAPVNMDFEGFTPVGAETTAWITQHANALTSTNPTASLDDLEPLRAMLGTASVLGLGDATYGTRESFLLKHRLVRFLVTRLGATTLAIEASSPEADDLNQYVLTGTGDPARLVSRLYVWPWNTQELLDVIGWMRQWNSTAPPDQRVQFRGFDMQHPGASIDSVAAFVHRVAPNYDADVVVWYQCLSLYRNRGATAGRPRSEYAALPAEPKTLCAEALADAANLVRTRGTAAPDYEAALHHARLVQQFEAFAAQTDANVAGRLRAEFMAENIIWLRERSATGTRLALWSHNEHVSRQTGAMGAHLQARFGTEYRPLGVSVGRGRFNALLQQGATTGALQSHDAQRVLTSSLEEAFLSTNAPLLLLDARLLLDGSAGAAPLRGPIASRTVGTSFNPLNESAYFPARLLPGDFDLLLFVRDGTASTLLPFVN